jgi:hypothetical protein
VEHPDAQTSPKLEAQVSPPGSGNIYSVLWDCAVQSFVKAILIWVLGGVAVGIAGGIWKQMTPALPPAIGRSWSPEAEATSQWNVWSFFLQHRFAIIFSTLFGLKLWSILVRNGRSSIVATAQPNHMLRIGKLLSEDWFSLIVGNAFGALISVMVLAWVQKFSLWYWVQNWVLDSLLSMGRSVANSLLGPSGSSSLSNWFRWYGENRLKLIFWIFYLAAICDDMGIPNVKTFGRWSWRRFRRGAPNRKCYGREPS